MNLVKIAKRLLAGDVKPTGELFNIDSHVYGKDVKNSDLDDSLKEKFLYALEVKSKLQSMLGPASSRESHFLRLPAAKRPVVDALRDLMESVRSKLTRWPPRFDVAFKRITDYLFPFDMLNVWYIDMWIQFVHELITAMFMACGGKIEFTQVPHELYQPEWDVESQNRYSSIKIARRILAGDREPRGESFGVGSHVYDEDVKGSNLDDTLKEKFLYILNIKKGLQVMLELANTRESYFLRLAPAKRPIVESLEDLMKSVKAKLTHWPPRFDTAFRRIVDYEFPFDMENAWYVDIWIQLVHELITAMFIACGGKTVSVYTQKRVPDELRQPEWDDTELSSGYSSRYSFMNRIARRLSNIR